MTTGRTSCGHCDCRKLPHIDLGNGHLAKHGIGIGRERVASLLAMPLVAPTAFLAVEKVLGDLAEAECRNGLKKFANSSSL
jgi:hypothetical protein